MQKIIQGQIKTNINLKLEIQKEAKELHMTMSSFVNVLFRDYQERKAIHSKIKKEAKELGMPMTSFFDLLFRDYMERKPIDSNKEK